jgi:hypothetical protein
MNEDRWQPPSPSLRRHGSLWIAEGELEVSYPDDGNERCFRLEDVSWWFRHRNDLLLDALHRHPPGGLLYDVGGAMVFSLTPSKRRVFLPSSWNPGRALSMP